LSIFRFDPEDDPHFELHCETIFRNHLEWIECLGELFGSPFDRLVGRRNDDRRDRQRVEVLAFGADDHLLNAAIAIRHDISFVRARIETPVRRIAQSQLLLQFENIIPFISIEPVEMCCGNSQVLFLFPHER
jgi:hypothetical protein